MTYLMHFTTTFYSITRLQPMDNSLGPGGPPVAVNGYGVTTTAKKLNFVREEQTQQFFEVAVEILGSGRGGRGVPQGARDVVGSRRSENLVISCLCVPDLC